MVLLGKHLCYAKLKKRPNPQKFPLELKLLFIRAFQRKMSLSRDLFFFRIHADGEFIHHRYFFA